jgi:drug/metabolite transporter (DMT)-like permease
VGKWAAFWLVALIWGSSFLLIRVGVEELSTWQVVFMRTGIAAIGLNIVLRLRGKHLPTDLREWTPLIALGIGNTLLPFILITWGEQSVESGLASVLNATAALFTLVIAHFAFADERITPQKVAGLVLGFIGVVVLASRAWVDGQVVTSDLAGQLAIVGASFCYGYFGVYSRKVIKTKFEPMIVSAGAMTTAAIASGIGILFTLFTGGHAATPLTQVSGDVLWAILILGLLNTFVAYLMFYWVIQQLGAARASMVTYVIPVVGLTLGALVLDEVLDVRLLVGAALIFAGIAVVNVRLLRRKTVPAAA